MKCSSHWLEEFSVRDSLDILRDLAWSHACEAGPFSDQLKRLIHDGRYRELCEFEVDYALDGLTSDAVRHARQAVAFFSKLKHLEIGVKRDEEALVKFLEADRLCGETNERLRMRREGTLAFPERVEAVLRAARRSIRMVLKDHPPGLDEVKLRFGPGSTRKTRKADASLRRKCEEGASCSEDLIGVLPGLLRELPHLTTAWSALTRVDEDGDEWDSVSVEVLTTALDFVPKNAKSYRSIGVEPLLNIMYQLAYGADMAKRLAAFGVDIRDQSRNQRGARTGSLTGELATLDLSSASDTVSREIVYELLPLDWACVLARGRSCMVELPDGVVMRQEKFSSMGNGYTFPLETLIFWGIASAASCHDKRVCVYGDDIIVPTEYFDLTVEVLRYAGFNVNPKKSFATTPFRESCGADYFRGSDVRPFYQKEWVSGRTLFVLHNWYVRHGDYARAKQVMEFIHPSLRIFGPDRYGDGHLLGDYQIRRTPSQAASGFSGHFFETFSTKSRREIRKDLPSERGDFPALLYTVYVRGDASPGLPKKEDVESDDFYDVLEHRLVDDLDARLITTGNPISVDKETGQKAWQLPGFDGYKKVRIYTLGD